MWGDKKNINGQINVSVMLVFHQLVFMVNFPQKFEVREFYESLHSSGVNSQARKLDANFKAKKA